MHVTRLADDAILIEDGRFAHFLPLLFGGAIAKLAGKGLAWAGKKAASAVGSLVRKAAPAALSVARAVMPSAPAPEEEEYPEEGYEQEESGGIGFEEEAVLEDSIDLHEHEGGKGMILTSPYFEVMSDEEIDEVVVSMADHLGALLDAGSINSLRDGDIVEEEYEYDEDEPPRFAHFKKLKKKLKKGLKGLTKVVGKLGPIASLIPGVGVIAAPLAMASKFLDKPKEQAQQAIGESIPQAQGLVSGLSSLGGEAAQQMVQQASPYAAQAAQGYQSMAGAYPMRQEMPEQGYEQYAPPRSRNRMRRRLRRLPPPPPAWEEEDLPDFPYEEYAWDVFDGETGLETGGLEARKESIRAHKVASRVLERDSVVR